MSTHSAILGGSNAARLLSCPAHYHEQLKNPVHDVESAYAAEGTALHLAKAHCIESKVEPEQLLGAEFYGLTLTEEHVGLLRQGLDSLHALMNEHGSQKQFRIIGVEETLPMPGIIGSFGSVDLIVADKRTVIIVDWKFGGGVPVKVVSVDGDEGILNPQLAFYAIAARARYKRRFRGKKIVLAVIQPRLDACDHVETDDGELDDFHSAFMHAFSEALGRGAHRERGEHCRFAVCKATCPLWTGPAFSLADIDPVEAALKQSVTPDAPAYGKFLGRALDLAQYAEDWAAEIRRQGHVFLESGGAVPGWKLVPKRATRQWIDAGTVPVELVKLGFSHEAIYEDPKLRSVAQMEKEMKKVRVELPDTLYHAVSTGTTIAPEDDRRPAVDSATVTAELQSALRAL